MNRRNKKITSMPPYYRYSFINIGTILFGAIFIYMIACVIIYSTARHTASYEVSYGSISGNYRYTALALKTESVISADYSGYVTYYARNGARTGTDTTVCTIDENNTGHYDTTEVVLTEEDKKEIREGAAAFSLNFSDSNFQSVYNFKSNIDSILLQAKSISGSLSSGLVNNVKAPTSGFVVYAVDGMENLQESDIDENCFNQNQYEVSNLRLNTTVRAGDPLYKLVSGESWNLYFQISDDLASELSGRTSIRFRFLKDDASFSAAFSVVFLNGDTYGKISLNNSLVRYVADRFLEIEILMDSEKGLKVPASSITERSFYCIPDEYVITNEDSSTEVTLLKESFDSDGIAEVSYITVPVYAHQDNGYLVSTGIFNDGDYVQMADTTKKHKITEDDLVTIQGVYNINQGYAQFRQVKIIDQNEEFCIVEPSNVYGLAAHDFIALDASEISTDDIIN